jgi:hypothetical protein
MKFNPIGMGSSGAGADEPICVCRIGGTGCGNWVMRHLCVCMINGCGCGRGRPGIGPA